MAEEMHAQPSFKDADTSVPTSEGKSTAHDVKVKEGLPEINKKAQRLCLITTSSPKSTNQMKEGPVKVQRTTQWQYQPAR